MRTLEPAYSCNFCEGAWNATDWMFVRRSDLVNFDEWAQRDHYIENISSANDGHTSMVYRRKFSGDLTATATLSFLDRMAPAIILAGKIGRDEQQRPQYEEHMEITLWDKGVNVWWHTTEDGKPVWKKIAAGEFALKKDVQYQLQVQRRGEKLAVSVDGQTFDCVCESLSDELHIGLTACEGINRLYDFAVQV